MRKRLIFLRFFIGLMRKRLIFLRFFIGLMAKIVMPEISENPNIFAEPFRAIWAMFRIVLGYVLGEGRVFQNFGGGGVGIYGSTC